MEWQTCDSQKVVLKGVGVRLPPYPPNLKCHRGEIGRHKALKMPRQKRAGSSPAGGTNLKCQTLSCLAFFMRKSIYAHI